jgi:hypothetical protein
MFPSNCKQGVGSQLMERFCNEVNCSAKAYLEKDLDENVRITKNSNLK